MNRTIAVRVEPASPDSPGVRLISFTGVGLGGVIAVSIVDHPESDGAEPERPDIYVEVLKGDPGVFTVVNDGAVRQVPAPRVEREVGAVRLGPVTVISVIIFCVLVALLA